MEPKTSPSNWPDIFKTWSAPIGTLASALTTLLITFGIEDTRAQIIGYVAVFVLLGVCLFAYKKASNKQRAKAAREERRNTWVETGKRTAFRGLYPYGESDKLPGTQRQREARRLLVQITDSDFSFGILCGDSGCGKTSLLRSELQDRLKEEAAKTRSGFRVLYIANVRELSSISQQENGKETLLSARLDAELVALRRAINEASGGAALVLIIDQFERFFIEYAGSEHRLKIGRFLNEQIHSVPPVRILCAIRRDYLVDVHDLAPALPDPISVKTLFTLKNFTIEEATEVINQCAEYDGIVPDGEFASTLASDLAEEGFVRPPELQIICTALAGALTMEQYRLSGGVKGILSHYIGNAVSLCGDPDLGRRVLRALCDFPARAKRNPQSVDTLREAVGSAVIPGDSQKHAGAEKTAGRAADHMREVLDQFEAARLIISEERRGEETKYSLVHDYLVDAVAIATSDVSTRTEEARQILEYYSAEYVRDKKTRIPFRKRRFAKKYGDRNMLGEQRIRRLMVTSLISEVVTVVGISAAVIVAAGLIYSVATIRSTWRREPLGSQWDAGDSGDAMDVNLRLWGGRVFTGLGAMSGRYARQWDVKTGKLLNTVTGKKIDVSPKGNYLFYTNDGGQVLIRQLETAREYSLPYSFKDKQGSWSSLGSIIRFNQAEDVLSYQEEIASGEEGSHRNAITLSLWSLPREREIVKLRDCGDNVPLFGAIVISEQRAVLSCGKNPRNKVVLWRGQNEPSANLSRSPGAKVITRIVSDNGSLVATLEALSDRAVAVNLWDVRTGALVGSSEVIPAEINRVGSPRIFFSGDGKFVLVTHAKHRDGIASVLKTPELSGVLPVLMDGHYLPSERRSERFAKHEYVVWQENETDTKVWEAGQNKSRVIKGLHLFGWPPAKDDEDDEPSGESANQINISRDGGRAVVLRKKPNQVELWDFAKGSKIKILDASGAATDIGFTEDGGFVRVTGKENLITLYRIDDGEKLMDLRNLGGAMKEVGGGTGVVYYNSACRWVNVWTVDGIVERYTQGHDILNNENLFWPTVSCKAD
jgi:WD40 repeat protein